MNRIEELIQREIDDDLSPGEVAELLSAIADDPELRARRDELLGLGQELRTLQWQEPGPRLRHRIMEEIEGAARPDIRRPRRATFRPERRQVLAFAAGILLMLVAGRMEWPGITVPADQARGTLIAPSPSSLEVDRGQLSHGDLELRATTARDGARLVLRVQGDGGATTPVQIEYDERAWSFVSVRSAPAADLAVNGGQARHVRSGTGPFTLEMELQLRDGMADTGEVRLRIPAADGEAPILHLATAPGKGSG